MLFRWLCELPFTILKSVWLEIARGRQIRPSRRPLRICHFLNAMGSGNPSVCKKKRDHFLFFFPFFLPSLFRWVVSLSPRFDIDLAAASVVSARSAIDDTYA